MTRAPVRLTKLVLGLPAFGLSVIALVVVFGLPNEPSRYAQVYGGPVSARGRLYARALLFEELDETRAVSPGREIVVSLQSAGRVAETVQRTESDGTVELELPYRPGERLVLRERATNSILAEGVPRISPNEYRSSGVRRGGRLQSVKQGEAELEGFVETGVLASPFSGAIILSSTSSAECDVSVSVSGGELESPAFLRFQPQEQHRIALRPTSHNVEVEVEVFREGAPRGKWTAAVPVVPGAFFPKFRGEKVEVWSPLSRKRAYFTWVSETSRLASGVVELRTEPDGTATGELPLRRFEDEPPQFFVLSTEPDESSSGTVGFPVSPGGATFDARDQLILDGRAPILARERAKAARIRRALVAYVGCVFALSLLLFVIDARRSARLAVIELRREGLDEEAVAPARGLFLATALLALGMTTALLWFALFSG